MECLILELKQEIPEMSLGHPPPPDEDPLSLLRLVVGSGPSVPPSFLL